MDEIKAGLGFGAQSVSLKTNFAKMASDMKKPFAHRAMEDDIREALPLPVRKCMVLAVRLPKVDPWGSNDRDLAKMTYTALSEILGRWE
jgi:hypothetical protein